MNPKKVELIQKLARKFLDKGFLLEGEQILDAFQGGSIKDRVSLALTQTRVLIYHARMKGVRYLQDLYAIDYDKITGLRAHRKTFSANVELSDGVNRLSLHLP